MIVAYLASLVAEVQGINRTCLQSPLHVSATGARSEIRLIKTTAASTGKSPLICIPMTRRANRMSRMNGDYPLHTGAKSL